MVQPIHTAVKGRARYKVKGLYRSEPLKRCIEKGLSEKDCITVFSVNTLTGHVLVLFSPETPIALITSLLKSVVSEYIRQFHKEAVAAKPQPLPVRQKKKPLRAKLKELTGHREGQEAVDWHLLDLENVLKITGSSRNYGLTSEAAREKIRKFGPNLLPEAERRSGLGIFFEQFKSLPFAMLGAAAALSLVTGGITDAILIAGVVLLNAAIGYMTESQAEKTLNSLKTLVRPSAAVVRNGLTVELKAEEVVPGDIIILKPGSYVTADSRLIDADFLTIDESTLTGESMPVVKNPATLPRRDIPLADRLNMVYMGTLVTGGQGYAVVVATGGFTEIGRIQELMGEAQSPETPMERQLRVLGGQLVAISGVVCGLVFVIGLIRGYGFLLMLKSSISLAVAAIPEGLTTIATTTLALGIMRMRRQNVLIRHLEAVETLGCVQTISFDKTGTITMNRMTVVEICAGGKKIKVADSILLSADVRVNPYAAEELLMLMHVSVICNETEIDAEGGKFELRGSPTENALINLAVGAGVDVTQLRARHPLLSISHRSANRNYMSTVHGAPGGRLLAVKGSPGEVLAMCDWHMMGGQRLPLTEDDRQEILTENERMAGDSMRVLGTAYKPRPSDSDEEGSDGLIWLGLIGMTDPVRKGLGELMASFHRAGIETIMITGDQSPTAFAIGKELNLSEGKQLEILDSTHLANMDKEVLRALATRVHVYSRVSPAHKLQIVQALQESGKIVAMTGDGINDGPALKAADIGIALGHTGTDVAREVADIILEDDNLETMIVAVSHGRTIYNNIRKSVHYLLPSNFSEIVVMFVAIAAGLGQPLSAIQLLWINLLSDTWPGLALALEPPEPDVLSRPPRDPHEPIIKRSDFGRIVFETAALSGGTLGAYGYGIARYGIGPRANTMAFSSLMTAQLLHAISCRSETRVLFSKKKMPPNKYLSLALGASLSLQALTLVVPGLRSFLGLTPIGLIDGAVIGAAATLPLLINELTKPKAPEEKNTSDINTAGQENTVPSELEKTYETGLHVYVGVGDGGAS
ncbi:MAG: HAD-IC family P-type ATPase [Nitrospirota bacterium]